MEAAPVKVRHLWVNNEAALMKRLHQIVSGSGDGPFEKDSGYRWQLDGGNDWKAEMRGDLLVVSHRYTQAKADALANLCKELFT